MGKRNIFLYEENKLKEVIEIINKQIKEAEENFRIVQISIYPQLLLINNNISTPNETEPK